MVELKLPEDACRLLLERNPAAFLAVVHAIVDAGDGDGVVGLFTSGALSQVCEWVEQAARMKRDQ